MEVIKELVTDLSKKELPVHISVVQGDSARWIKFILHTDGKPWEIPKRVFAAVRYQKADGTVGTYDTLPNGSPAWRAEGNCLFIALAPQACAAESVLQVTIFEGESQVSTFQMFVHPQRELQGAADTEDYTNLASWLDTVSGGGITVAQTTGESEEAVMSQKAVTEKLIPFEMLADPYFVCGKNELTGVTEKGNFTFPDGTVGVPYNAEYQTTDMIPVIPNCRYRITKNSGEYIGFYPYVFTDAKNDGVELTEAAKGVSGPTLEFTIPEGKTYLAINFICTGYDFSIHGLYRITQLDSEKDIVIPQLTLPKPLAGKVIVNFGDSIFGNARAPEDISTYLAGLTGATVHNCGFGGCRMATHPSADYDAFSMYRLAYAIANKDWTLQDSAVANGAVPDYFAERLALLKTVDFNKVDIITLNYGANDWNGIPLDNENNALDTETYLGALRYTLDLLLTAFPHLKVVKASIAWRYWMDGSGNYTEDTDTKTNGLGLTVPQYNAAAREVIEGQFHCQYIDLYNAGINKYTLFLLPDGAHQNEAGRMLLAKKLAQELYV